MDCCLKNKLSKIKNLMINFAKFVVQILLKFVVQDLLRNLRDEAWKNKDMDLSNVPKAQGCVGMISEFFLSFVRGWSEDPHASFWNYTRPGPFPTQPACLKTLPNLMGSHIIVTKIVMQFPRPQLEVHAVYH